ncbi:MAG: TonB-dependent receptor [Reichenbachiella sp.]
MGVLVANDGKGEGKSADEAQNVSVNENIDSQTLADISVTGKITDEKGDGLPGASVIVKGTSTGTVSDIDGNFTLNAPDDGTLIISFIGYATQEIAVSGRSSIDVGLELDAEQLEEVVVLGYGTQKKSDVTGAVSVVSGDEIGKYAVANATQAIQGRMAGVRVESNGGAPGAGTLVTIRGSGTMSERQPLYVIDGMLAGNMNSLNPNDIESVSVLKDASATAIYGSRAANGVVVVTTKKGKAGAITVDFEASYGVTKVVNTIDWANNEQYAEIVRQGIDNDNERYLYLGGDPAGVTAYPEDVSTMYDPNINSDIQDATLRDGMISQQNLRIAGGGENSTISFSAGHLKEEGVVAESAFERYNLRLNSTFTKGKFDFQTSLGLTRTISDPNTYFNKERDITPTIPIYDSEGNFTALREDGATTFANVGNSLGVATLEDRTNTRNAVIGNVIGAFEIVEGLTYRLNLGLTWYQQHNFKYTPEYFFSSASTNGFTDFDRLDERNDWGHSGLMEHTLNYKKSFGDHNFDVLAGYSSQQTNDRRLGVQVNTFPNSDIRNASQGEVREATPSYNNTTGLISYFGRLNYNFGDRYLLTATIRRDGSSLFREDLRWGTFPSFAVGWNISNEGFMDGVSFISDLKLRASYGEMGSNNANAYVGDAEINVNSSYPLGLGFQEREPGISITKAVNENLQWETTVISDIGVEFGLLDNKLRITMDYFDKQSNDVIAPYTPPPWQGRSGTANFNMASISNKGFEFSATYGTSIGDLKLNVGGNFTILDNEVTEIGFSGPIVGGGYTSNGRSASLSDVGQPIAAFYGLHVIGVYQSYQEAIDDGRYSLTDPDDPNSVRIPTAGPGDLRFEDLDGVPGISDDDMQYLGSPIPTLEYGININAEYKGFDLTLFFNGVSGNKILNGNTYRAWFEDDNNMYALMQNAWTTENPSTTVPRVTFQDLGGNGTRNSDFMLESGAYFRLRNIMIGYTLPSSITEKIKLSRVRFYGSAQNLFTITDYTGYYPEVGQGSRDRGSNQNIFNAGVDENAYPMSKNFIMGVQISF